MLHDVDTCQNIFNQIGKKILNSVFINIIGMEQRFNNYA